MSEIQRTDRQWMAINQAIAAGPEGLTPGMYQAAVVAQVVTDTPEAWPLGSIEGRPPAHYMADGAFEEYEETRQRAATSEDYDRLHKLLTPLGTPYQLDEVHANKCHLKEFGDLSWYVANILASHNISFDEVLPATRLLTVDEFARADAQDYSGLAWRLPGHHYLLQAKNFLQALTEINRPLPPGDVAQFFRRRNELAERAGNLLLAISVVVQTQFKASLAQVLYDNLQKIEQRAAAGTILHAAGDEREVVQAA